MSTNLPIPANKIRDFSGHSSGSRNPGFSGVIATLFVFAGIAALAFAVLLPVASVFAEHPCTGNQYTDMERDNEEFGHPCGGTTTITTFGGLVNRVNSLLNTIVPFLVGLAVFIIIWGVFTYVTHAADEEKRMEARRFIVWSILFVFFMLSIWGFVNILANTFSLQKTAPSQRPNLPAIPEA